MDFKDASARMREKKAAQGGGQKGKPQKPVDFSESYRLRGKMIGVLLRDARLNAARTVAECASLVHVSPQEVELWEQGDAVPSLPQLELLAYYLGISVSHFWGSETLEALYGRHADVQLEYMALRNRMIGAMLVQARGEAGLTVEQVAQDSHLPVEQIAAYEQGDAAIPMHELNVIAGCVKKNVSYFLESSGHFGELLATREQWRHFSTLREDLREFAANPRNIGFIEIALMLSKMPAEQLRSVGASILEITR